MSNPGTPALLNCAGTPARVTIHPPTPPVTRSRRRDEQLSTVPFIDSIPETDDSLRKKIKAQENELAELRRQIAKGEEARKLQEQHEEIQMLRHRLAQNEADQREAALREAMATLRVDTTRQIEELKGQIINRSSENPTIELLPPQPLPRMKIFTGLPPTGNLEGSYEEWRTQAKAALNDTAIKDPLNFLKRSLRGVTLSECETVKPINASALLKQFDQLFGDVKNPEDLLFELYSHKQSADQKLSDLLTVLYGKLMKIKELQDFTEEEFSRKLYQALSKACTQEGVVQELRSRFGFPGEASPSYQELLGYIRRVEDLDAPRMKRESRKAVSGAHQTQVPEPEVKPMKHQSQTSASKPSQRYCYKCGQYNHIWNGCKNPANPELVHERDMEQRIKQNLWRERMGLPTLHLN